MSIRFTVNGESVRLNTSANTAVILMCRSVPGILSARADFGFYCDAMNLKGMWGFAYYWDSSDWYIAWPFPENDWTSCILLSAGKIHAGIQEDSRCLHTLHELAARKGETVPI
ncbi:MAG: hypothetical protein V8T87_04190 [Victivallales bacterium]